ncbi:MAG: transcription termination/antitermination protein NusA [Parachlamydiales bacterium]|nr:transcription termination/antitermination protein NusA [Parachlamydiales bacterium]
MNKDLLAIFEYLEREKGIKRELVIKAIEDSIRAAAKKTVSSKENVDVSIDPKTAEIDVYVTKTIVDVVEDSEEEISIEEAKKLLPNCEVGQRIEIDIPPSEFGRIAAQTARQIISQKLKVAERDVIYEEYRHRIGEIISGTIKKSIRGRTLVVDLGKVEAFLPEKNIPRGEKTHIGERIQALLYEVHDTDIGGAEVILTRAHPEFVAALFTQEVPELADDIVKIEKIVREPGYRTKMAVSSTDPKIDPVGTCVGVRGTRIKNVIREINNEKIDVIPYSSNKITLLENALSPIELQRIIQKEDKIRVIINDEDYPIIIGKKGMNARLLGKLLDTEIEFQKLSEFEKLTIVQMAELSESDNTKLDEPLKIEGLSSLLVDGLISAGYDTIRKILQAKPDELITKVPGINYLDLAGKILEQIK